MKDSILWDEESDNYTSRAKKTFGDVYNHYDRFVVDRCIGFLDNFEIKPRKVLDLGCAYGGFTFHLLKALPDSHFVGVDPGVETVRFARENVAGPNVSFLEGHAHALPFPEGAFDLIILNMVLQWIPRSYLMRSLAEIERVLAPGGAIFAQEFSPFIPKYSSSSHDENIFIFKDDYASCFTSVPWLKLVYSENLDSSRGDDYQKIIFAIQKINFDQAYFLKTW